MEVRERGREEEREDGRWMDGWLLWKRWEEFGFPRIMFNRDQQLLVERFAPLHIPCPFTCHILL